MKLTRLLKDCLEGKSEITFEMLLVDFGLWSRGIGAPCYKTFNSSTAIGAKFIDDESALQLSKALMSLKVKKPELFKIFKVYYIKQDESIDIITEHTSFKENKRSKRILEKGLKNANKKKSTYTVLKTTVSASINLDVESLPIVLKLIQSFLENELKRYLD